MLGLDWIWKKMLNNFPASNIPQKCNLFSIKSEKMFCKHVKDIFLMKNVILVCLDSKNMLIGFLLWHLCSGWKKCTPRPWILQLKQDHKILIHWPFSTKRRIQMYMVYKRTNRDFFHRIFSWSNNARYVFFNWNFIWKAYLNN